MAVASSKNYRVYNTNDDVVTVIAQAGDWIREHAADLVGTVIGDDIHTNKVSVEIEIKPMSIPTISARKNYILRMTVPFEGKDE